MKAKLSEALTWWASLTPTQTKEVMSELFLPHVSSTDLSNKQIKRLYNLQPKYMCDNCGGGFIREEMAFDVNDQDLCKNCNAGIQHENYMKYGR